MLSKDSHRRRLLPAPHGRVPNWLLVAVAGAVTAAALLARTLG